MLYNNYDLQRGDRDGNACAATPELPRWGGNDITAGTTVMQCTTPATGAGANISIPAHVHKLQLNLLELGFFMLGDPSTLDTTVDGKFGRGVEWAVREFQIYAKMTQVAKVKESALHRDSAGDAFWACSPLNTNTYIANDGAAAGSTIPNYRTAYNAAVPASGSTPAIPSISKYVDSLESVAVPDDEIYTGRISGVVNEATRDAIEHWLENDYRCPVVIEDWKTNKTTGVRTSLKRCNLWNKTEGSASGRVHAYDFTSHYDYPSTKSATDANILGKRISYGSWGGLQSNTTPFSQLWAELEVSPEKLIGSSTTIATLNLPTSNAKKSTFKVVRAAAEAECHGVFDSMNAYDNALISLGLCHWTLGIATGQTGKYNKGELGGTLAYFKANYATSFNKTFGHYGLDLTKAWGTNGSTLKVIPGKYACWIKWDTESGTETVSNKIKNTKGDSTWFACWHWFFRFAMVSRTVEDFRKTQWDMVRIRIKDMLDTKITLTHGALTLASVKIGDIYTSEKAIAYLYRYHIWRPSRITHGSHNLANNSSLKPTIGMFLKKAVDDTPTITPPPTSSTPSPLPVASVNWALPITNWADVHEKALLDALEDFLFATDFINDENGSFIKVKNWADGTASVLEQSGMAYQLLGKFSKKRDSFMFDNSNI